MPNLNVKRIAPAEARRIRAAARARAETMKQYVLAAGLLRADLIMAVEHVIAAGAAVPPCPVTIAGALNRLAPDTVASHARTCPICEAAYLQQVVGYQAAPGWAGLLRDLGDGLEAGRVKRGVEGLPEREREVLTGFYGLAGRRLSKAEVARAMGISRERVRQLAERAMALLRTATRSSPTVPRPRR